MNVLKKARPAAPGNYYNTRQSAFQSLPVARHLGDQIFEILNTIDQAWLSTACLVESKTSIPEALLHHYLRHNTLLAGEVSAAPGQLGIFSYLDKIKEILYHQMIMICKMAYAYEKKEFLNKDVLLELPIHAYNGDNRLHEWQFSSFDHEESSFLNLKNKSFRLAKYMIQKELSGSMVHLLPISGATLMESWARKSTWQIGEKAMHFFSDETILSLPRDIGLPAAETVVIEKVKLLVNLLGLDGYLDEEQLRMVGPLVQNLHISAIQKERLLEEIYRIGSNFTIDYEVLRQAPQAMENLFFDMVTLAKRRGLISLDDLKYIHSIKQELRLPRNFVDQFL